MYPEGTLTRDPGRWPMRGKTGAARIARETGCRGVPVVQWGPQDLLEAYQVVPRLIPRPRVTVVAGQAVDLTWPPQDACGAERAAALVTATEKIMDALTRMLEEVRGEAAPSTRWDPERHGQPVTGNPASRRCP